MIPAALIGMLAVGRLGAIHSVVFGGFAANALAQRIDACKPLLLLTASCGIVGNRPPIAYQGLVEEALDLSHHKPARVVVWQRNQKPWQFRNGVSDDFWSWLGSLMPRSRPRKAAHTTVGESCWQDLVESAESRGLRAGCTPVNSSDPLYIMHTSGTTGTPKGVLRDAGGHAVGLRFTASYIFDIRGPGHVCFTASDIGWVVGHSYILYAPLLAGATTVLYEGKPVGTPDASAFWRVVEEYGVQTMFTAPTALRAIKQMDPHNHSLARAGERGGLRSLRALFLAGERSEPALVTMYQDLLSRYGGASAQVVDNWWSTEIGSPITARALSPLSWLTTAVAPPAVAAADGAVPRAKPGSAGKPMPGFDVRVVDDQGCEVTRGAMGNIVLRLPLGPTAFHTLWEGEDRFYASYLERFGGRYLDTGDAGWLDEEGYVYVMSRNDDVINVGAVRLSSGTLTKSTPTFDSRPDGCCSRNSRTSHLLPSTRGRELRGRHPRCPEGPPALRIRKPLLGGPCCLHRPGGQGDPIACEKASRCVCVAGWQHHPGRGRAYPENEVGKDITPGPARAPREWPAWGIRKRGGGAEHGGRRGGCRCGSSQSQGVFRGQWSKAPDGWLIVGSRRERPRIELCTAPLNLVLGLALE